HPGRIHRPHLRRSEGPPAVDHRRQRRHHSGGAVKPQIRRRKALTFVKGIFSRNRQLILYCVIGAGGVTLDFLVYSVLIKTATLDYQAANAVGYSSGTLLSFFLNAHLNFKTRDWLALRLLSFCVVALLGWAASA